MVWLWTIEPILPSLAAGLDDPDPDRRREALARFAEVVVGAEALAETHELLVELDPAAFAVQVDGRLRTRYVGERLDAGSELDVLGPMFAVAERFATDEIALADYAEGLCLGFHHAPRSPERRAALVEALGDVEVGDAVARIRDAARLVLRRPAHG